MSVMGCSLPRALRRSRSALCACCSCGSAAPSPTNSRDARESRSTPMVITASLEYAYAYRDLIAPCSLARSHIVLVTTVRRLLYVRLGAGLSSIERRGCRARVDVMHRLYGQGEALPRGGRRPRLARHDIRTALDLHGSKPRRLPALLDQCRTNALDGM